MSIKAAAARPLAARALRCAVPACRPVSMRAHRCSGLTQQQQQQPQQQLQQEPHVAEAENSTLPLSLAAASLLWAQPLAAWADEASSTVEAAAQGTQQAATDAAAEATNGGPTWLSYVVVLSPIVLYGIFNLYRDRVNPRIKFSDFLFIVAGVAVVANLVSIIGFKVRLF